MKGKDGASVRDLSISRVNETFSKSWSSIRRNWKLLYNPVGLAAAIPVAVNFFRTPIPDNNDPVLKALHKHELDMCRDSYDTAMARLMYWNPHIKNNNSGGAPPNDAHLFRNAATAANRIDNVSGKWPFDVIPTVDLKSSDPVVKRMSEWGDQLRYLFDQIELIVGVGGGGIAVNWFVNAAGANPPALPAAPIVAGGVRFTTQWLNTYKFDLAIVANPQQALAKKYNEIWEARHKERLHGTADLLPQRLKLYNDCSDSRFIHQHEDFEAGLVVRFNQILSRYLAHGWDSTSQSMYAGLIEQFASGSHSQAVMNGMCINDIDERDAIQNYDSFYGLPPSHCVLFASLARFMRNVLLKTKHKSTDSLHKLDSLMDVPIHMKENYRFGLVEFNKLFNLVKAKSLMLKSAAHHVSLQRIVAFNDSYGHRIYTNAGAGAFGDGCDVDYVFHDNTGFYVIVPGGAAAAGGVVGALPLALQQIIGGFTQGAGAVGGFALVEYNAFINAHRGQEHPKLYTEFGGYEQLSSHDGGQWNLNLMDDLVNACVSVSKCAMGTYMELGDEPKFMEVHEGSILDYQNLNKVKPIMLLSQTQIVLRNRFPHVNAEEYEWDADRSKGYAHHNYMLPVYASGHQASKLQYGTRLIFGRPEEKLSLEYYPGMEDLLDKFNGVVVQNLRMDRSEFELQTVHHTDILRYIMDTKFYKSILDTRSGGARPDAFPSEDCVPPGGAAAPLNNHNNQQHVGSCLFDYPLEYVLVNDTTPRESYRTEAIGAVQVEGYTRKCTLDECINITESSNADDIMKAISKSLKQVDKKIDSRKIARIYNIIDLNIVPINVHALMRDIPLINLINYSYTCDRMMQDTLLGRFGNDWRTPGTPYIGHERPGRIEAIPNVDDAKYHLMKPDDAPRTTREMMCKMLIYPYCDIQYNIMRRNVDYTMVFRIVTGDSGMDLGRPRFLGDQLWNKVLLGSLYGRDRRDPPAGVGEVPDELGPIADNDRLANGNVNRFSVMNPNGRVINTQLQYLDKKDHKSIVKNVDVNNPTKVSGLERRDLKIVRDLFFLVQIQRVMRMIARDEISYIEHPVVNEHKVLNRKITEYVGNELFDSDMFNPMAE